VRLGGPTARLCRGHLSSLGAPLPPGRLNKARIGAAVEAALSGLEA
jgi:hypothetical protein